MFTFLNSAILAGLLAAAIPILIHLFTRKKVKTVYFSSLKFLKELQRQKIRRLKIRQILLLVLRTLLILILVLAFARPALKSSQSAALEAGARITAVILLDNTLSMGRQDQGVRLLERAKERARQVVHLLRPGDEIHLLYPQDPPKWAHDGPRFSTESVLELIDATEISYRGTDYVAALGMADEVMNASNNINKEVYLIGDLQRSALRRTDGTNGGELLTSEARLFVLPVQAPGGENVSVVRAQLGNQILERGKVVEVEADVRNTTDRALNDRLVHLFVNGQRVAQQTVNLQPLGTEQVTLRMIPEHTGLQSGYVMVEDDQLPEDNRRYFTFRILDEIPVLLISGAEAGAEYIRLAFAPDRQGSYVKVHQASPEDLSGVNLADYRVVILNNVPRFDQTGTRKLQQFVEGGGGLVVFLGANVNLRNYNEYLHTKLNLPLLSQPVSGGENDEFLSLGKIDFSHPIFRGVFQEDKREVASPHIRVAVTVRAERPLARVIEYSNGEPMMFETQTGEGRVLYFTTGLAESWSDLAYRGLFVPLIYRSVTYVAGGTADEKSAFLVGDEIVYQPEGRFSGAEFVVERPDGSEIRVKPEVSGGAYTVRFRDTEFVGIYQLNAGEETIAQWVVNANPQESYAQPFEVSELEDYVSADQVVTIDRLEGVDAALQQSRYGRELWKYLVIVALALMVMEMLLMRERAEAN